MEILNFRYADDIDVTIQSDYKNKDIFFKRNGDIFQKVVYRKYFKELVFNYDIFSGGILPLNYVKMTAKDGGAFLARVYDNGSMYVIRKKKRKPQIVFARTVNGGPIQNFQLDKDITDVVCYLDGVVSDDKVLINDFFTKRQSKEFDEEKFLKSLCPEDRKEYLDNKRIENVLELVGKKYKIESEKAENLAFYIECLDDENEIKAKVLNSGSVDEIASVVLPLMDTAKKFYDSIDSEIPEVYDRPKNIEYTIDRKYVFLNGDFDSLKLEVTEEELFINDLFYFFLDEYEQIKEYLNKGIERVKKTIDELLPYFRKYIDERKA